MRLTGPRRGNPALRFMIEQTARRRLWSGLSPERGDESGPAAESAALRWGRPFYERVRDALLPRMAAVAETPEGQIRYYGTPALRVWALVAPHATALAHERDDLPAEIRDRARRWHACLTTRTAPGLASPHWGHPIYGARLDALTGELDVVWALPGEWCDAVAGALPEREWDQPRSWSEVTAPA